MSFIGKVRSTIRSLLREQISIFNQVDEAGVQLLLTRKRLAAIEVQLALTALGRKPRYPVEFRSQFGEDLWIWNTLGGQTDGFFVELGAFDGYNFSVSYALEAMGWNGLLIEALPGPYAKCSARRKHSRVENMAMGRQGATGTISFVSVEDDEGGMLSYTATESEHAKRVVNFNKQIIEAKLSYLDELLKDHAGPIDVISIDVEGAELDVLDGFSLEKFRPRLLLIEDNERGKDPALAKYMASKPYVFAGWLAVNRLYIRRDETSLLANL